MSADDDRHVAILVRRDVAPRVETFARQLEQQRELERELEREIELDRDREREADP